MARKSNKKNEIYEFIKERVAREGYPPSVREIAAAVGLSSPATVYVHLTKLRDEGKIEMTEGKKRSIILTDEPVPFGKVPIVGNIAAGDPILMDEHIEGYVDMSGGSGDSFALKVRGDSMIGAGIFDGDLVLIDPSLKVESGDIAAVCDCDEATVKRVYFDSGALRLVPENPAYREVISRDARIVGKVSAVVRYYV